MVISLERDADLHVAQLMLIPLTVSCSSKIQIGFTFLVPLTQLVLDKGLLNVCVCVALIIDVPIDIMKSCINFFLFVVM